jgi:uncharacterized membrane-anchored protein
MKLIGIIAIVLGAISLLLTVDSVKAQVPIQIPAQITSMYLTIIGIVLLIVGLFLIKGTSNKLSSKEIPIYKGNQIVGYRQN